MIEIMIVCVVLFVVWVGTAHWEHRGPVASQQPRPWWYSLLARIAPGRCREIPEADNPTWCEHKDPVTTADIGEPLDPGLTTLDGGDVPRFDAGCVGLCKHCGAPPRIVLRQFSLIKRRCYLQQFACSEDPRFMHSHPAEHMIVFGLWGCYTERRIAGKPIERVAPYLYTMDRGHVHHVQNPGPGHTSIFLMFGLQHDDPEGDKKYFGTPEMMGPELVEAGARPFTVSKDWKDHIRRKVERI